MRILFLLIIFSLYSLSSYGSVIDKPNKNNIATLAIGDVVIKANQAIIYENDKGLLTVIFPKNDDSMEFKSDKTFNLSQSQFNTIIESKSNNILTKLKNQ
ncbi:hypothetical protein [Francisella philomiragia]|uniref:Uncharacterized protein n=1 Tax=Francisella philomiragia subsp. philomiragia (strain ATCC 25017 / CCUG 19701 / FSC 153 / O\|nr:hypothetical protein [Francisella philomiragia]AJI47908.1 hypothetical protein BF30_976 [Francisella philomiragia]AJI48953.1 hypothetical protein KU46_579 [Francisella philomiragia]